MPTIKQVLVEQFREKFRNPRVCGLADVDIDTICDTLLRKTSFAVNAEEVALCYRDYCREKSKGQVAPIVAAEFRKKGIKKRHGHDISTQILMHVQYQVFSQTGHKLSFEKLMYVFDSFSKKKKKPPIQGDLFAVKGTK